MALSTSFTTAYAALVDRLETHGRLRDEGNIGGLYANRQAIDELRYRLAILRTDEVA